MGLTKSSTGKSAAGGNDKKAPPSQGRSTIALAGNPNVGKSTVFNSLTGMKQHTGNWPGKTVVNAQGYCKSSRREYLMVDIPGTYSLTARSAEEEVARDFICFGAADAVVVVCDATCLERNLNLVLQTMEISSRVLVCVNLLDEAGRKGISIDLELLSKRLGVPVIGIVARHRSSRTRLLQALDGLTSNPEPESPFRLRYPQTLEEAVERLLPVTKEICAGRLEPRWLALRLLEGDTELLRRADDYLEGALSANPQLPELLSTQRQSLEEQGIDRERLEDMLACGLVRAAESLCREVVSYARDGYSQRDRRIDRLVTGRLVGYPLMILLLALVFYLTIVGANYPSQWLSGLLFGFEPLLFSLLQALHAPIWLQGLLVEGAYRVLAWVVSVMLPPMAIFFPLFTLLEDAGYLPRIAYNLDGPFRRCKACGKQALTM